MFTSKKEKETKNTISQEEYERRLKELQDEIEQLKKIKVEEPKKKEIWKPKFCNYYYYIDGNGKAEQTENLNTAFDIVRLLCANYYKTLTEAKHQANVRKYTNLFRKYVEEHSEPLDWEDNFQEKWCIYWSYKHKCIGFCSNFYGKYQGIIYANSEAVLEDAIEFVGKDNVIKYVLGVNNA